MQKWIDQALRRNEIQCEREQSKQQAYPVTQLEEYLFRLQNPNRKVHIAAQNPEHTHLVYINPGSDPRRAEPLTLSKLDSGRTMDEANTNSQKQENIRSSYHLVNVITWQILY